MKRTHLPVSVFLVLFVSSAIHSQTNQTAASGQDISSPAAVPAPSVTSSPLPSAPPLDVSCKGDQLTISASNSTLASILDALRKCIGSAIEIPEGAGDTRFFDTIGPGPIREVLASLFSATGLNYVIEASDADPGQVQKVVLLARADKPATETAGDRPMTPTRHAFMQMVQNARPSAPPANADLPAEAAEPESGAKPQATSPPPENPGANPGQPPPADSGAAPSTGTTAPEPDTPAATPSTPGTANDSSQQNQINSQIMNMQQMFEQRRQMMQNTNPPPQ